MLHGANQPYNVALVVVREPEVRAWAREQGIELADVARDPRVERRILDEVRRYAKSFRGYEVPRRVLLTTEEFTIENDLLTPTLKLKRRNVEARYGAALYALYAEREETERPRA